MNTWNPAQRALAIIGAAGVILGGILWIWGANQLNYDNRVNGFAETLVGGYATRDLTGDWALIITGIILLGLGVILLVALLIIRAATKPAPEPAPKTYEQYLADS